MRKLFKAALAVVPLAIYGCGGYGSPSPMAPGGVTTAPAGVVVIDVVGQKGTQSFSPNPATVAAGTTVSWHNVDTVVHRVVLDDGEVDSGNIPPGGFSAAMPLVRAGAYHCTIHPSMVGAIVSGQ